jgi:hypothetical protein
LLGWLLWLSDDLAGAREQLEAALSMAERIGESLLHVESLIGLALVAIRRHDAETVRALTGKATVGADSTEGSRHLARISACQAWLAWHDGRPEEVTRHASQAAVQAADATDAGVYCRWIYL